MMIQNYNDREVNVKLKTNQARFTNAFNGTAIHSENGTITMTIQGRSRVWLR